MTDFGFSEVYRGLKDFQRTTVDYVFNRLYGEDPVRRFLVADEVGLGKTLVARGVVAKAVEHLDRSGVERIDVIYICSNAEIAAQNIRRLSLPGFEHAAYASRLTLLPIELRNLSSSRLNFVSFTPGTALDLRGNSGRWEERVVLYWLLKRIWPGSVGTKKGPMRVFQGGLASLERFEQGLGDLRGKLRHIEPDLVARFGAVIESVDEKRRRVGSRSYLEWFEQLASDWAHDRTNRSWEEAHDRNTFVGDMRNLLAKTCINALEPDLVILDEFQRFRHVLDPGTEASELAHALFDHESTDGGARVLLLSATPYKMYTLSGESDEDDHFRDFTRTAGFLLEDRIEGFRADLADFRRQLLHLEPGEEAPLIQAKQRVEATLRTVMCRTERLGVKDDRSGMLEASESLNVRLEASDLSAFVGLDRASQILEAQQPIEYWKSAPYFANFWDGYQIGRKFDQAVVESPGRAVEVQEILSRARCLLDWSAWEQYGHIDPANARLRHLTSVLLDDAEAWRLLWLPPSFPYYELDSPFAGAASRNLTKRLVFSSWAVVPKVIAAMLSYEAERRMMLSRRRTNLENTSEGRERFAEPLRFPTTATSGMTTLALIYPSHALCDLVDPAHQIGKAVAGSRALTRREGDALAEALRGAVQRQGVQPEGPIDERWYWLGPILLDLDAGYLPGWLDLAGQSTWTGDRKRDGGAGFGRHLALAREVVAQIQSGNLEIGSLPEDIGEVLAFLALGAPGTVALRALLRLADDRAEPLDRTMGNAAARIAWSFRSLFNTPEVTQVVRASYRAGGPYWRRVLRYAVGGCIQAVMDEYLHVLKDFEGIVGDVDGQAVDEMASRIADIVAIRSADLQGRDPLLPQAAARRLRCRFALPFGQYKSEDDEHLRRSGFVRSAFNSPFWPFVLTTTSVGQEGLDFHLYCHAVVHWNLPANPVDLEQREGRVHRYMGHAVRKNLAHDFGTQAMERGGHLWNTVLELAIAARDSDVSDLVPFWIYPGEARIERHTPHLPLSREEGRLLDLLRSLALYRMVIGQPRQEDLVRLLQKMDPEEMERLTDQLRIDLTPGSVSEHRLSLAP